jgi:hypothetical protein
MDNSSQNYQKLRTIANSVAVSLCMLRACELHLPNFRKWDNRENRNAHMSVYHKFVLSVNDFTLLADLVDYPYI